MQLMCIFFSFFGYVITHLEKTTAKYFSTRLLECDWNSGRDILIFQYTSFSILYGAIGMKDL